MRPMPSKMAIRRAIANLLRQLRALRAILRAIERYESSQNQGAIR